MFLRNLIFGWRNIGKNGIYSIINIIGLSLALAVAGLILIRVSDELNYDTFHENPDHIYSVSEHQKYSFTIAIITVSWQSLRAATRNPVESLPYE